MQANIIASQLFEQFNTKSKNLCEQNKKLLMQNKRLQKQNSILQVELNEKNRIIEELKKEIDETIVEDTKNRLCYIRYIEQEVEKKTTDMRQKYLEEVAKVEKDRDGQTNVNKKIEKELQVEKEQNRKLVGKLRDMKEHMIATVDEKDMIINELVKMVSGQSRLKPAGDRFKETQKISRPKVSIKRNL